MMKLKHLFNNVDMAAMLLGNWDYDKDSLDMFKYYRISANAVYPFKSNNQVYFLRFAPSSEKSLDNILAELEFIEYLNNVGYPCVQIKPSRKGNILEVSNTPWGEYYASVFKRVPGVQINDTGFDDNIIYGYGQSLAELHKLSSKYVPESYKRWSWHDMLKWVYDVLSHFPDETSAMAEVRVLEKYLSTLPVTSENFGLIHYDFESDNVFYDDASKSYYPIDFDDACYHWFVVDIEQALDSLEDDAQQDMYGHIRECFITGYRSRFDVSDDMLSLMPVFRRFINLYGYVRVLRSSDERWNNEPEWLLNIRVRLSRSSAGRKADFGKSIL